MSFSWITALFIALPIMSCSGVFVSNLQSTCMRCLCEAASSCNTSASCLKGYCGPYYISRIYWAEAGKPVLDEDEPEREGAYQDCALDYNCAIRIVENYMVEYGRDCNGDGVTNCDDYAMIHYNGGRRCEKSLEGTSFNLRYLRCRPGIGLPEREVRRDAR